MSAVLDDRIRELWEYELDRLELDVLRTERLLKGLDSLPVESWCPPAVPGQMPADLADRAQDLLDRQERAIGTLHTSLSAAQRQLAYTDRVAGGRTSDPVYLDLEV